MISVGLSQVTIQFVTMAGSVRVCDAFIRSGPSLTFQTSPYSIVLQEHCFVLVRNVFDFDPSSLMLLLCCVKSILISSYSVDTG